MASGLTPCSLGLRVLRPWSRRGPPAHFALDLLQGALSQIGATGQLGLLAPKSYVRVPETRTIRFIASPSAMAVTLAGPPAQYLAVFAYYIA